MASDPYDLLDGPLTYLARDLGDLAAPVTLVASREGRPSEVALPIFSGPAEATVHLPRLPSNGGRGIVVRTVASDDPRGKEEVLRAAVANGVGRILFDPDEHLRPRATLAIDLALGYLIGHKRNSACI